MKADGSDQAGKGTAAEPGKELVKAPLNLYKMLENPNVQKRFEKTLGDKYPAFLSSVLSVVKKNPLLERCDPAGVLGAAATAAELDLAIEPSLGLSAIIPYQDSQTRVYHAQFQIMTKGITQLALRSAQYETIYVGPVYSDEFMGIDIVTGEPIIEPVSDGLRSKDLEGRAEEEDGVCGWIGYFKLLSGFVHKEYWSVKKILAHGRRYSKTFKKGGLWATNRPAMFKKTVMKNMLSHSGAMSTQLLSAIRADQSEIKVANYDSETGEVDKTFTYVDNPDSASRNDGSDMEDGPAMEGQEDSRPLPDEAVTTEKEAANPEEKPAKASAKGPALKTAAEPSLEQGRPGAVPGQTVRAVPASASQPAANPADDLDIF